MNSVPVIGFVAASGTGKTTLLQAVIRELRRQGLRVAVIKQARDDFDVDTPGKDSYALRQAGARRLLLTSPAGTALIDEHQQDREPVLDELLTLLDHDKLDLILVEGFAQQCPNQVWVDRQAHGPWPEDELPPSVIAVVSDRPGLNPGVPLLDLNRPPAVAAFLCKLMDRRR